MDKNILKIRKVPKKLMLYFGYMCSVEKKTKNSSDFNRIAHKYL